ncbi:MAG TPA: hypothetical protein VNA04_06690 [Thermoanaerobaculia bacterium]|nr:hypothetical protein [Thermoanaerobaculia bacterium]
MRPLVVPLLALALFPFPGQSQSTLPLDEKVEALAVDLRAISRIATLAKDLRENRQVMQAMVEEHIDSLREKRADGTFRWASLQREEGGRVSDEKRVRTVESEKELQTITVSAPNAYRIQITAPRKRGLFTGNNRVFVRNIIVESTPFSGAPSSYTLPVNVWVEPGDTHGVVLPDIGKNVRATAELGVESGRKQAVAEVAIFEAKLVDDPTSPYFPAVRRLLQLREIVNAGAIQRGPLKTIADEALLEIPGEIAARAAEQQRAIEQRKMMLSADEAKGTIQPGDATPDVVHELSEIQRLLSGTIEDQAEGRRRLEALAKALGPRS